MSSAATKNLKEKPAIIAAVEGGGTTFKIAVCQVLDKDFPVVLAQTTIETSKDDPAVTLAACASFLQQHKPDDGYYQALGLATFGPVGVRPNNPATYGRILASSPKAAWRNVDLLTPLTEACSSSTGRPTVLVETDVNAPAVAEFQKVQQQLGASAISSLAYVTVGTGVGVGLVVHGQAVHGRMHPEGGHVPVIPLPDDDDDDDTFGGYSWGSQCSPFGGRHTVEGLASSVALTERLQKMQPNNNSTPLDRSILETLPDDHQVWAHAANALANLCVTLCLMVSVEKIVLGGGIMERTGLLEKIRERTMQLLNGYLPNMEKEDVAELITKSDVGKNAGIVGAIALAQRALQDTSTDEEKEEEEKLIGIKRTAFGYGLWHGFLAGAVGTALVCKYIFFQGRRKR